MSLTTKGSKGMECFKFSQAGARPTAHVVAHVEPSKPEVGGAPQGVHREVMLRVPAGGEGRQLLARKRLGHALKLRLLLAQREVECAAGGGGIAGGRCLRRFPSEVGCKRCLGLESARKVRPCTPRSPRQHPGQES